MKSTFYINEFSDHETAHLIIEISETEITFGVLQNKRFTAMAMYQLMDDAALIDLLDSENLLQNNFSRIDIIYSNKECVLVPPDLFNQKEANKYIDLLYGDLPGGEYKTDFLYRFNMHGIYRVKNKIYNSLAAKFPFSNTHHQYSLLPGCIDLNDTKLYTLFYQNIFVVLAGKEKNIQLLQQFEYKSAEDVAYYLLSVAKQYHMDMNALKIELCGMINNYSALYNELHKYFYNLSFSNLPDDFTYADGIKALPVHYFAHIFSYATCV